MSLGRLVLYAVADVGLYGAQARAAPAATVNEEIIVTAQRWPEKPEDVPISLTARSGEHLRLMQATDMAALAKVVPSLVMTRTGPFTQPYLRGIGKRSTLGVENAVATYVDGVYLASSISALLDLRGVERIEVLNGPQGTLFGRNTTGGVIQIVTRDPNPQASAEATLHGGSYGHLRGDIYLTGGNDRLAANLAMSLSANGGYGTNLFSGKSDQGEIQHSLATRTKWVWRPSLQVKFTLAGDYQDLRQDFSYRPAAGFPPIGEPRILDFRDGDQDSPVEHRFKYGGISLTADVGLGSISLMSLTALRWMGARYGNDLDQGPQPLWSAVAIAEQTQISQEFQFKSRGASPVRWIAGLYYVRIEEAYDPTRFHYGGRYSEMLAGRVQQTLQANGKASSYAVYGQASLPIVIASRLTLGARLTMEHRSIRAAGEQQYDHPPFVRPIPGLPLLDQGSFRDQVSFRELSWRASLERRFSEKLMGYVSVSRGFQSGGWNLQTPQAPAFGPERLDAFEAGLKYVNRPARLSVDASAFFYDYSDLQVSAITPIGSATLNAASAEVYGLGLQVDTQLAHNLTLGLGLQWLDARFKRFPNAFCLDYRADAVVPYAPISCDVTGNQLPFAPGLRINFAATRRLSLEQVGNLDVAASASYNSGYFSEADNVARQRPFATIDGFLEWRPKRSSLSFRIWALNLTDSQYYNSLAAVSTAGVLQSPAAPRRFGASVGFAL